MTEYADVLQRKRIIDSDNVCRTILTVVALIAVVTVIAIIVFIAREGADAFGDIGVLDFLTGDVWRPYADSYGSATLIVGSLLVTAGAMAIACPLGIGAAVYLSEVASSNERRFLKPIIEVMSGIPSVVYGMLGMLILVPFIHSMFPDQTTSGLTWLAGSLVLGIMALPTVTSVSDDALRAVPNSYREASQAVGATKWETIRHVIIPAASSGISAAVILGVGRAIGETMAVMMVTGNTAVFPDPAWDVFSGIRTLTATLAIEMPEVVVGSTWYSALFFLALILMVIVLVINIAVKGILSYSRRKFSGNYVPGRFGTFMEGLDEAKKDRAKEFFILIVAAAVVYCAVSLFASNGVSIAAAVCAAAVIYLYNNYSYRVINRNMKQKLSLGSLSVVTYGLALLLVVIIVYIAVQALPALSLDFITEDPVRAGRSGGIYPAIIGTLELLAGTALVAIPVGVLAGVYLAEYAGRGKITSAITTAVDVLNGTPSVVFGLFGMVVFVTTLGPVIGATGYNLVAGCLTLGIMTLPVVIRTTQEAVMAVPADLREASRALGATKAQTTFKVVLPAAICGIVTGSILGLARASGETAPIMFTAVVVQSSVSDYSLTNPVMALPYHLYFLATEGRADPSMTYATAFVLMAVVLSMFLIASWVRVYGEHKMNPPSEGGRSGRKGTGKKKDRAAAAPAEIERTEDTAPVLRTAGTSAPRPAPGSLRERYPRPPPMQISEGR